MVSDPRNSAPRNSLYTLAAAAGALLGLLLLAAAFGHFAAVWPAIDENTTVSGTKRLLLLLPGLVLTVAGLINVLTCRALWIGMKWALHTALAFNGITATYLVYLLSQGVPGHPIGFFLTLVLSSFVMLSAIRVGLVWPAAVEN
ncbi:MAG: hypothetical protein AB8B96_14660 [Lysobacterales bacterium]